jgi:cytochrome P450
MQPAFHRQRILNMAEQMTTTAASLLTRWESKAKQDTPLDIHQEMLYVTLRVAGATLFGQDFSDEHNPIGAAFERMVQALAEYVFLPFPPLSIPTPRNRRMRATLKELDELVRDLVHERREHKTDTGDLLSMLLMDDQQLYDEIISLLFAGYETTANTLTWAWYELSRHPEVERRLWEEVDTVLHGEPPGVEHLSQLPYTRMVLDEVLRLYAPTFALARRALADDTICGYRIPANHLVWVNIYAAHRHPAYWEQPEVFNPDRFSPEHPASGVHTAYFPFGSGPHLCIGNSFALMEGQFLLAMIAQRYRLRLASREAIEPVMELTVRPRHGLPMRLEFRV